jgi:deoxyribodipyrimidine photo-lyase
MDSPSRHPLKPASHEQEQFPPFRFTALRRVAQAQPREYARTRNHLDGAVTALSPYVTHGLLPADELFDLWQRRRGLTLADKLLGELAWREFYHHVWHHRGDAILEELGPGLPGIAYAPDLPRDIRQAATGVPVIDASVRRLYDTGYLHNHQRMWLASYVVHLRKVHWRAGADWMYGHLLDGDLAANHLSWQWVAGTFSRKPYLFNADNVARYAPHLASPDTAIDHDYADLETLAHSGGDVGPEWRRPEPVPEPPLLEVPSVEQVPAVPAVWSDDWTALVHPWSLDCRLPDVRQVGILHADFHRRFPWSARRWNFVLARMAQLCETIHLGDMNDLAPDLGDPKRLMAVRTFNPGYRQALDLAVGGCLAPAPMALPELDHCQPSYSAWFKAQCRLRPELCPAA